MVRLDGRREGFALVAALFGLVLIGAIVTGSFFAVSQEASGSRSNSAATEAFYLAEQGLAQAIGSWNVAQVENAADGAPVETTVPGGSYTITVRHLGGRLYLVESTGIEAPKGRYAGARRSVAAVARTVVFTPPPRAMQVGMDTEVKGSAEVNGMDIVPTDWENCGPSTGNHPGLVGAPGTELTRQKENNVRGEPPMVVDPTLSDEDFEIFGDFDLDLLRAQATITFGKNEEMPKTALPIVDPNNSDRCLTGNAYKTNWGAPKDKKNACHNYFPIIYHAGDGHINGGQGQGILLVEGNLELNGDMEFFGIVIVKGKLTKTNGNATIIGTMIVKGESDIGTTINGNPVIQYSRCAVQRAAEQNPETGLVPVVTRSWLDLSAAGLIM
jgi:hypothetical protein